MTHDAPNARGRRRPTSVARLQIPLPISRSTLALALLAVSVPVTSAQSCISLQGSSTCPSFSNASISTGLSDDFSFLSFVSDLQSFDNRLRDFIGTDYAMQKYQQVIGCSSVNLNNTTELYARYTTSFICNALIRSSEQACGLSGDSAPLLCADSCAQFAMSEQNIAATPELCGTPGANANDEIYSDYTRCQLDRRSLRSGCIDAVDNEPTECGFGTNLAGLCSYCGSSSPNATDSCCVNANVESRCQGVHLPTTSSMPPLFTSSSSAAPSATSAAAAAVPSRSGLSGGAIAGIVIGSLIGAALILGAIIMCCIYARKRKQNQQSSILNTPSPTRQHHPAPPMSYGGDGHSPNTIVPGARVARMSALEGSSSSDHHSSPAGPRLGAFRDGHDYDSPESRRGYLGGDLPKRDGSLSSRSALGAVSGHTSPLSGSDPERNFSSPDGVASGQSEQLQFFKDYYSQDDIHPNATVATLWAYQPRANDELELERGDMLKVVGIWDDGWATGVKLSESVEEWESRRALQRDSGVSNGSRRSRIESDSDIKAFPLVCVCLPEHWRKTIEGDSTDTGGSGGDRAPPSP